MMFIFEKRWINVGQRKLMREDYSRAALEFFEKISKGKIPEAARFRSPDDMVVIATLDMTETHGTLLHGSISLPDEDPTWADIREMKMEVFGDIDVMMLLPEEEDYVNLHEHTFHLWQTPEKWGIR